MPGAAEHLATANQDGRVERAGGVVAAAANGGCGVRHGQYAVAPKRDGAGSRKVRKDSNLSCKHCALPVLPGTVACTLEFKTLCTNVVLEYVVWEAGEAVKRKKYRRCRGLW